jgi:hypothetical protein
MPIESIDLISRRGEVIAENGVAPQRRRAGQHGDGFAASEHLARDVDHMADAAYGRR